VTTTVSRAITIPAAALAAAIALGGLFAPAAARAGEYCSEDGYSATRNCSFSSMEQCKATISGMYAACLRDPFLKNDSIEAIRSNSDAHADLPSRRAQNRRDTADAANK
jgi:hypothetical protein